MSRSGRRGIGVGIVGAGARGVNCIGRQIAEQFDDTGLRVAALCDRNRERVDAAARLLHDLVPNRGATPPPKTYLDASQLIADPGVDLVVITTPSYLHREGVTPALRSGKKVYLDKPIAHTAEDGLAIFQEEQTTRNPLIMGFTRRYEAPWRVLFERFNSGCIGELKMMQLRAIVPYTHYFQTWHRRRQWSGDALNDKSSHHCDVFNWFADSRAVKANAFGGRNLFIPRDDAPETCRECQDRTCPYRARPLGPPRSQDDTAGLISASFAAETEEAHRKNTCVWRAGADIIDHASIHYAYENGVVASLMSCIYGPQAKDQETFELIGVKGRMILTRSTGQIDVASDYGKAHEVIDCKAESFGSSHFGADAQLIRDMRTFCDGGGPPQVSAWHGMEATRMVMAALTSIDRGGETVQMRDIPGHAL